MIDVTNIYNQINGFAGVCKPQKDADGKWVLHESSLNDPLLEPIHDLLNEQPIINHKPIIYTL